jgi:hypothetical protein
MKNAKFNGHRPPQRKNVVTEAQLRKIIAEEISTAFSNGTLDEGFFDDVKSRLGGFFGRKEQQPASAKAAQVSELDVKRKKAIERFDIVERTLQAFNDNLGTVGGAVKKNLPPPARELETIKRQIPAIQNILEFGKQTVKGLPDKDRVALRQSLNLLRGTLDISGDVALNTSIESIEKLNFGIDALLVLVQNNKKDFMNPTGKEMFRAEFATAREAGEPFVFEGKLMKKLLRESPTSGNSEQAPGGTADAQVTALMGKLKSFEFADATNTKIASAFSDIKNEKYDQLDNFELAALGRIFLKMIQSKNDADVKTIMNILTKTDEAPRA